MNEMGLVVTGAGGRMGRALVRTIAETPSATLIGALEQSGNPELGRDAGEVAGIRDVGVEITDDPLRPFSKADGVLDFSTPAASVFFSELAAQSRIVHVIGTTGFSASDDAAIVAASRHSVTIKSANMSLGVNLLESIVAQVAAVLGDEFDIEILEMHHRNKVDSPSGTALTLGKAAARGRGVSFEDHADFGRGTANRDHGPRRDGDIGLVSMRGGSVICDHTIVFAGPSERIEFTHRADDRKIFARGAVRAALWGRNRKPGLYSISDVLELNGRDRH